MQRRGFLGAAALGSMALGSAALPQAATGQQKNDEWSSAQSGAAFTIFQNACMTLPYSGFTLDRAIEGIRKSGYKYIAWGVSHVDEAGTRQELLPVNANVSVARVLAARCRTVGMEPVMMFSTVNFEEAGAADAYKKRIDQASEADIRSIIVFGKTTRGGYADVVKNLQAAAKHAEGTKVKLLVKQHGGNTATGQDCSQIIAAVNHPSVKMCYDAGNVLDYENHDPIPDIQKCWRDIYGFSIKDHRNFPVDQDCGAGFGEIDHYRLLATVMRTGLTMPLACENLSEPLKPRPTDPEEIDRLALRSRLYVETVLSGLQTHLSAKA